MMILTQIEKIQTMYPDIRLKNTKWYSDYMAASATSIEFIANGIDGVDLWEKA